MDYIKSFEKCRTFIDCQINPAMPDRDSPAATRARPTITFSRLTGSGAHSVSERLAEYLHAHEAGNHLPWTVFDKNLVEKILEDHHLPSRLARYMPERKISELDDAVGELLGLHPSSWTLVEHTADTLLRLAKMGNAILVGRGAAVIAAKLPNAFQVRLIGSLPRRAERVAEYYRLSQGDALSFVEQEDRERARFLHKYFGRQIDDPLLYHLTINTDLISFDEAAKIVGETVIDHFQLTRRSASEVVPPTVRPDETR